jgi:hypothetical protein
MIIATTRNFFIRSSLVYGIHYYLDGKIYLNESLNRIFSWHIFKFKPLKFTLLNYHISHKNTRVYNYFLIALDRGLINQTPTFHFGRLYPSHILNVLCTGGFPPCGGRQTRPYAERQTPNFSTLASFTENPYNTSCTNKENDYVPGYRMEGWKSDHARPAPAACR